MIELYFTVADEKDAKSTIAIPLPDSVGLTNIAAAVQGFGSLLEPLIQGQILTAGARVEVDISGFGWSGVAGLNSDVEEGARFVFRSVTSLLKSLRLPTFNESKFNAQSADVDLTDTDVAAFATAMTAGLDLTGTGGTGTASPVNIHGDDLDELVSAKENFTRSRG